MDLLCGLRRGLEEKKISYGTLLERENHRLPMIFPVFTSASTNRLKMISKNPHAEDESMNGEDRLAIQTNNKHSNIYQYDKEGRTYSTIVKAPCLKCFVTLLPSSPPFKHESSNDRRRSSIAFCDLFRFCLASIARNRL